MRHGGSHPLPSKRPPLLAASWDSVLVVVEAKNATADSSDAIPYRAWSSADGTELILCVRWMCEDVNNSKLFQTHFQVVVCLTSNDLLVFVDVQTMTAMESISLSPFSLVFQTTLGISGAGSPPPLQTPQTVYHQSVVVDNNRLFLLVSEQGVANLTRHFPGNRTTSGWLLVRVG